MTGTRSRLVLLAGVGALTLTACASTTSGGGSVGGSGSSTAPTGSSAAPTSDSATSAAPTDAAALTALMRSALTSVTSVHIAVNGTTSDAPMTGSGDETFAGGKLEAAQVTENLGPTGDFQVRIVGGKLYLDMPISLHLTTAAKPWLLVSATSNDPVMKELSGLLSLVQSSGSLSNYSDLAHYASSVKLVGADEVNGAKATHYAIVVDPTKLPADFPGRADLIASGMTSLPYDLWIDGSGRMLKLLTSVTVKSITSTTTTLFTNYNAKVSISEPPASLVTIK